MAEQISGIQQLEALGLRLWHVIAAYSKSQADGFRMDATERTPFSNQVTADHKASCDNLSDHTGGHRTKLCLYHKFCNTFQRRLALRISGNPNDCRLSSGLQFCALGRTPLRRRALPMNAAAKMRRCLSQKIAAALDGAARTEGLVLITKFAVLDGAGKQEKKRIGQQNQ